MTDTHDNEISRFFRFSYDVLICSEFFISLFIINLYIFRQKLTSPKWNRFKGIRLRWKDKIRLNNLIWRCWHMQCMCMHFVVTVKLNK